MKTTKRGKLLMLACAALVAALACLPLLWFRAQDARMFGTVNQSSGLYESREVSGDDFYLLQQVKNRTQMNRTDWMVSAESWPPLRLMRTGAPLLLLSALVSVAPASGPV